jgi:RHS repeat-associated protein
MQMKERSYTYSCSTCTKYRFGFNGMEKDDDIKGDGNSLDFGARIYDSRLGRWLAMDKLFIKTPDYSPYNYCFNNPLFYSDPDGNFPEPKTKWQRFINWLKGETEYNDFADYKSDMESFGLKFVNIDYSIPENITFSTTYTVVRMATWTEVRDGGVTAQVISAVGEAVTTNFGYGEESTLPSLENNLRFAVPVGMYNPYTGEVRGSGAIEPMYIEEDLISGGRSFIITVPLRMAVRQGGKKVLRKTFEDVLKEVKEDSEKSQKKKEKRNFEKSKREKAKTRDTNPLNEPKGAHRKIKKDGAGRHPKANARRAKEQKKAEERKAGG